MVLDEGTVVEEGDGPVGGEGEERGVVKEVGDVMKRRMSLSNRAMAAIAVNAACVWNRVSASVGAKRKGTDLAESRVRLGLFLAVPLPVVRVGVYSSHRPCSAGGNSRRRILGGRDAPHDLCQRVQTPALERRLAERWVVRHQIICVRASAF